MSDILSQEAFANAMVMVENSMPLTAGLLTHHDEALRTALAEARAQRDGFADEAIAIAKTLAAERAKVEELTRELTLARQAVLAGDQVLASTRADDDREVSDLRAALAAERQAREAAEKARDAARFDERRAIANADREREARDAADGTIAQMTERLVELEAENGGLEQAVDIARERAEAAEQRAKWLDTQLARVELERENARASRDALKAERDQWEAEAERIQASYDDAQGELAKVAAERDELREKYEAARRAWLGTRDELNEEIDALSARVETLLEMLARARGVACLHLPMPVFAPDAAKQLAADIDAALNEAPTSQSTAQIDFCAWLAQAQQTALADASGEPPPVSPLADELVAQLSPGVRDLVVSLRRQGFETTDSGDGTNYRAGMEGALPFQHVFIRVEPSKLVNECVRLARINPLPGASIDGTYNPADGTALIMLALADAPAGEQQIDDEAGRKPLGEVSPSNPGHGPSPASSSSTEAKVCGTCGGEDEVPPHHHAYAGIWQPCPDCSGELSEEEP